MNDQQNKQLNQLDLFKLLRLEHLTAEEKTAYVDKISQTIFAEMVAVDLPLFMPPEKIDEFNKLLADEKTQAQAQALLKEYFPDVEDYLMKRMLDAKKSLVRGNIEERLEINKQAEKPNPEEKTNLEQTLVAIDNDDWATVERLITPTAPAS